MSQLIALRLYFHHSATASPTRFWHRFKRPNLARHLLRQAKHAGIEQALLHQVHAGYLNGDRIHHRHVEHVHHRFPHCLEFIDVESKLRAFWLHHGHEHRHVHAVFLPCESANAAASR
ncbi:DUF190 domain-containing protein [Pararobbsia silviterrae]|uniref:Uncharacterized protein n=1 Tax=Pararobbsia silviterrae TaxID=1792498 RepID=A0A494XAH7_9BURK|nr:DUF190 domain-containing protein [Pararobbsia silviterrae]RKP47092.1 hypothetical protein D7S86_23360 [Pararobbsia silviterrae]